MTISNKIIVGIQVFFICTFSFSSLTHAQYGSGDYGSNDYNDTVDIIAPTLAVVTSVPTPSTDTTPTFIFSSDEAGVIAYTGSCSSSSTVAISGNNSISFNALAVGTYSNCTIVVTDTASNSSTPLSVSEFTIQAVSSGGGGGGRQVPQDIESIENSADGSSTEEEKLQDVVITTLPTSFTFDHNISYIQPTVNRVDDVQYLSRFLNEFEGEKLVLDNLYGVDDREAIKRFQIKYKKEVLDIWGLVEPTGYVGITTRLKINFLLKGQTAKCPAFTEYNGGRDGIFSSDEVRRTQEILTKLDLYDREISGYWTPYTHDALVAFQELFREVMLDPWGIQKGTGYKYKTTNKFLNYFAGCDTPPVELEGIIGTFDF